MIDVLLAATLAATPPEAPAYWRREPWLAATMGPVSAVLGAGLPGGNVGVYLLAPALLGAGQWYLGNPWKAVGISLGSYPVAATGLATGLLTGFVLPASNDIATPYRALQWGVIGMGVVTAGYVVFVGVDGFLDAQALNREHGL